MTTAAARVTALHRAIWRWHFWAGLIVAPFLLTLSLTGAIYLFNDELNDAFYPELRFVPPAATMLPPSALIRAARAAVPGAVSRIDLPATTNRPAVVFVTRPDGAARQVSVDPGTGRVLGTINYRRTLVGWADEMHGSLLVGTLGDRIVELAASWALVLIGTGLFLWWPRGRWRAAGTLWPRLSGGGRRLWRDLHGPVGLWSAALIGFLILTGLPWAGIQGEMLQRLGNAAGIGYPASFRTNNMPESRSVKATLGDAPWALEAAPMPHSGPAAGQHADHGGDPASPTTSDDAAIAGVDRITALLARQGWHGGYSLHLPRTATGVYTAYAAPDRPEGQRTVYVDRYSHRQIGPTVRFMDYGWLARVIELGVAIHMGTYFGLANQLLMLLPCVAIWVLTVSGVLMWWRRRPQGRLGAPPRLSGARTSAMLVVLAVAGVMLPLFGASLLLLGLIDAGVQRLARARLRRSAAA